MTASHDPKATPDTALTQPSTLTVADQSSKPNAGGGAALLPTETSKIAKAERPEWPPLSTQPVSIEKGLAIQHGTPILPARHPNLGLAPFDMKSGFPDAAARLLAMKGHLAARALEFAVDTDDSYRRRYDDAGLRRLIRDGELLVERLATSVSADDVRWIAEYCEWVVPIYRRKRIPLQDLALLCTGMRDVLTGERKGDFTADESASALRALDAADVVLRRNGRVAGDRHKRRPLLRWLYRGV